MSEGARARAGAPGQIARFIFVGGAATSLYAALTMTLMRVGAGLAEASLISYVACAVLSFLGHRIFTFASRGYWLREAARFAALSLAGLFATWAAPLILSNRLGFGPIDVIAATCVVAPAANYLAMRGLIFRRVRRETLIAQ